MSRRPAPGCRPVSKAWRALPVLLGLLVGAARAEIGCKSEIFDRSADAKTYLVLLLLDPPGAAAGSAAERSIELQRLISPVKQQFNDIVRKLSDPPPAFRPTLEVVPCEYRLQSSDLEFDEVTRLARAKVVAIIWKAPEDQATGMVQLALPLFLRDSSLARDELEVAVPYPAAPAAGIDAWREALNASNRLLYQPFVAMATASIFQKTKAYKLALQALCASHAGLQTMAPLALRPKGSEAIESSLAKPLRAAMLDLRKTGLKEGATALPSEDDLRTACTGRAAALPPPAVPNP